MTTSEALQKTISSYRKLIRSPEIVIDRWKDYGKWASCILCTSIGINIDDIYHNTGKCIACPLYKEASSEKSFQVPCVTKTLLDLKSCIARALSYKDIDADLLKVKEAAKARLSYIIETTTSNGFDIHEIPMWQAKIIEQEEAMSNEELFLAVIEASGGDDYDGFTDRGLWDIIIY